MRKAERRLRAGTGRIAVDTERAGGFRYDDRAFLLQLRRSGSGTLLIDTETHREIVAPALAEALTTEWVLHDASTDLPSLRALGLKPTGIFDTAIAARLLNIMPYRLPELCAHFLGVTMRNNHGQEDWSRRPLPQSWLNYAALDVEMLLELADACEAALAQAGKLDWAAQEFTHILQIPSPQPSWETSKPARTLKRPQELAIVRGLWQRRDTMAQAMDVAAHRVLPDKAIVAIAKAQPSSVGQLARLPDFPAELRRHAGQWLAASQAGLSQRPWPKAHARPSTPSQRDWEKKYPDTFAIAREAETLLGALHQKVNVHEDSIVSRKALRSILWAIMHRGVSPEEAQQQLALRPWQMELITPLLAAVLPAT
ncbi:HRDC domain-containing protein [Corynebacterium gerontici]|nr:HRDC domain-containing protein [Corynebacterium gerontici]